jgi:small nuclear ribonucleoprotein (snRNP)-like protein
MSEAAKQSTAGDDAPAAAPAPKMLHEPGVSMPLIVLQLAADSKMDVLVDVVNGYRYLGKIDSFDQHMNTCLSGVTVTKATNPKYMSRMASVFLRGQQIINIVMPPGIEQDYVLRAKAFKSYANVIRRKQRVEKDKKKKAAKAAAGSTKPKATGDDAKPAGKKKDRAPRGR